MSREMRHSGIEWIGEIPKEWNLIRAKGLFAQRNSKGNKSAVLLSATQKQGMMPQSLLEGVVQVNSNTDLQTFKTVHINDYVISLRSFQGGFEKSNYEGVCSPAYQVFYNVAPIDCNYYWLLFKSYGFVDKINSLTVGIREGKNIQYKDFANMVLAVPPLYEQQKIANYLDKVCGEVDEMIALQEQMIEELKAYKQSVITETVTKGLNPNVPMKDSGIDWIGEIPENWKVIRIKYLLKERKERSDTGLEEPLSMSQKYGLIPTKEMDAIPNIASSFVGAKLVYRHDLVFNKLKAHLGVFAESDYDGLVSPDYAVYYSSGLVDVKYLEYLFKSPQYIAEFIKLSTGVGAGLTRLYTSDLYSIYGIVPPIEIQREIVDYIRQLSSEINTLIAIKQTKIEELKEYKKSVIYEYVTGKKEVV